MVIFSEHIIISSFFYCIVLCKLSTKKVMNNKTVDTHGIFLQNYLNA